MAEFSGDAVFGCRGRRAGLGDFDGGWWIGRPERRSFSALQVMVSVLLLGFLRVVFFFTFGHGT